MRRTAVPLLIALLAAAAGPAAAGERTCKTSIEGTISEITYDTADDAVAQNRSFSERAWAMFGNDTCPGYVTLRAMTPDLTDAERGPFCLLYDPDEKTFTGFSQGERDRYLLCTESRTFCEKVNAKAYGKYCSKSSTVSFGRPSIFRRSCSATVKYILNPST